jgi:hypothetical protein
MSEWQQAASGAGAPDEVVALLEQSATGHGLFECARGGSGEIGLGAEPDAYAAVYVGRSGLSLALSPEQAADLASACGLSRLERNPTTHYVRVPAGRLDDRSVVDRVREAIGIAVDRSWRGPRWTRGTTTGPLARIAPTCPVHHYELAVNGWCTGCDDVAPAL